MSAKVQKTDQEWQKKLTPQQYQVLRQKGTEPPFTGKYAHSKEAGTFVCAGAITGGDLLITGCVPEHLRALTAKLQQAGASIQEESPDSVRVRGSKLRAVDIKTEEYPGFATDLQAQYMSVMTQAEGISFITETIFENRFMHVPELARMGANINVHQASAMVRGVPKLTGAPVMATDLRASVSLVLAGLAAEGETMVHRVYHLDRGYERLEDKLGRCGATVERISG